MNDDKMRQEFEAWAELERLPEIWFDSKHQRDEFQDWLCDRVKERGER